MFQLLSYRDVFSERMFFYHFFFFLVINLLHLSYRIGWLNYYQFMAHKLALEKRKLYCLESQECFASSMN